MLNKIKNLIKNNINKFKNIFTNYPVTVSSSMITSIILIISSNSNLLMFKKSIVFFLIMLATSAFLTESTSLSKTKRKILYGINCVISLAFTIINHNYTFDNFSFFNRFLGFYCICNILIGILFNYKKSKQTFSIYLLSLLIDIIKTTITYFILLISFTLLIILFEYLMLDNFNDDHISKIFILLSGIYYIPSLISSFKFSNSKSNFINILINKVCFSIILIAYIIIYLYLLKVIFITELPNNVIYYVIVILFISSTIISLLFNANNTIYSKINKILPLINIPLIILQIYTLGIRITEYGITIPRYIGIMIIIFEISYTCIKLLEKNESYIIYSILALSFTTLLMPFVNYINISFISQKNIIIDNYLTNNDKAKEAYIYIQSLGKEKQLLKYLDDKQVKSLDIENIDDYYYERDYQLRDWRSGGIDESEIIFDIENYNSMTFNQDYYKHSDYEDVFMNKFVEFIENESDEYFKKHNEIILENEKIIIRWYSITLDKNNKVIDYSVDYYLLKK